jgi:alpha-D-xyloside xylohydrolase
LLIIQRIGLLKAGSSMYKMQSDRAKFIALGFVLSVSLSSLLTAQDPKPEAMTAHSTNGGMQLENSRETVQITFCGTDSVHVFAKPADAPPVAPESQPWIVSVCKAAPSNFSVTATTADLSTADLKVIADLATGALRFEDASGKPVLEESKDQPRRYAPARTAGQHLYQVSDRFSPEMLEGFYGLGQHQSGVFNYRGSVVELAQANSDIDVPLMVSTNGYGIFWNTASKAYMDDRFSREMKLSAEAAPALDYYVFYGPQMDRIIHLYRELTGHAPLLGEWAYGFIQSKDRYTSAKQLLDIAAEYRTQHVPLDTIVQDWFWWKQQGDPVFSEGYLAPYPDVAKAVGELHAEHVHSIISTWAVLAPASSTYKAMLQQNLLIPGTPDYDASNPKARDLYWDSLLKPLVAQGWDGFWLDSSEPETWHGESDAALETKQLHIGPGAEYVNVFPLLHTGNVYDHWRQATDKKRVFLLTRSAFAGQQRNSTVEWSGDIFGTFPVLKRQIAAGLNFALSGMPYWTTDVAGYTSPYPDESINPQYQELYTRWYEFGAFCPIFRTHGHRSANEVFSYGPQTPTLIAYDKLRSKLLPYIYSLAWRVTKEDYTIQRPLVMDWPGDTRTRYVDDQFMFGSALLVSPVTEPGATERLLYLPPAAAWFNFWTGEALHGAQQILAKAPLDRIPLFVRAGSILPMGAVSEWAGQQKDALMELRIYPGADGDFTLYSDQGDGYQYEAGAHATIALHWDDQSKTLHFKAREGSYDSMPKTVTFEVIAVSPDKGVGIEASTATKTIVYKGKAVDLPFR